MNNSFVYTQPVKIYFGKGKINEVDKIANENGMKKCVLVCDSIFAENGLAEKLKAENSCIVEVFSELSPNPMLSEVMNAVNLIKKCGADFVVAMGGGSSMDLAKFACSMVKAKHKITDYFYKKEAFGSEHLPLIAVPTTAGTGSEVTCVSVCNDDKTGTKAPLNHNNFYAKIALIDPELTLSVPKGVTANTGIDALSHALEGFWSKNHQPVCDIFAFESCKLIFKNLEKVYLNGKDIEARENMILAALYAGFAFTLPKTAASHACSYPLSIDYHMPHGEACAFTLDKLIKINKDAENGRLDKFCKKLGFSGAEEMADEVLRLKKKMNMKCTLSDAGIKNVDKLAEDCACHPLMNNNPINLDKSALVDMFNSMR